MPDQPDDKVLIPLVLTTPTFQLLERLSVYMSIEDALALDKALDDTLQVMCTSGPIHACTTWIVALIEDLLLIRFSQAVTSNGRGAEPEIKALLLHIADAFLDVAKVDRAKFRHQRQNRA